VAGVKFDIFNRGKTRARNSVHLGRPSPVKDEQAHLAPDQHSTNSPSPIGEESPIEDTLARSGEPFPQTHAMLEEVPGPRQERLAQLRQQVHSGTYEIPVPQLVRILADLIFRRR
jgi:hypothetical protein